MASRIRIFDKNTLAPIAVVSAIATYSWKLNDVGRCEFELNNTDQNCNRDILRFGNLVLIEHLPSLQEDGVTLNGQLPTWVGVIAPPRDWNLGKIAVNINSAEHILRKRPLPLRSKTGTPSVMVTEIISLSNSWANISYPINIGDVDDKAGQEYSDDFSVSALEHLQNLAAMSGGDFQVRGAIGDNNKLSLYCDWKFPLGVNTGQMFSSINSKEGSPILSEQGDISTVIMAYSDASTDTTRIMVEVIDQDAYAEYGFLAENVAFDGVVEPAPLTLAAKQLVGNNSRPVQVFDFSALDVGDTFDYLALGNIWDVRTKTAGFMSDGSIGYEGKVRITSMEYSDADNQVRMSLETIT